MGKDMKEKIEEAKARLVLAAHMSTEYYGKPLIVTYSGGKDSEVLLHLALGCLRPDEMEVMHNHTTVDAPQTVYHVRKVFAELKEMGINAYVRYPMYKGERTTMWELIEKKQVPPTIRMRYCCDILKESATPRRYVATGVRSSESTKRRKRKCFEIRKSGDFPRFDYDHVKEAYEDAHKMDEIWDCTFITAAKKNKNLICNPVIDWSDEDVWDYIHENEIRCNPLYGMGYKRVGCIGCPLARPAIQNKEFEDFPTYKRAYIRAFQKMVEARRASGKDTEGDTYWNDGESTMRWWLRDPAAKKVKCGSAGSADEGGKGEDEKQN